MSIENTGFIKKSENIFKRFNKELKEKYFPSINEVKKNYVETPKIPFANFFSSNKSVKSYQNLYFNKHNSQEIVVIDLDKDFEILPMKVNSSSKKN